MARVSRNGGKVSGAQGRLLKLCCIVANVLVQQVHSGYAGLGKNRHLLHSIVCRKAHASAKGHDVNPRASRDCGKQR
jgi:hypothetical protein